MFYEFEHIGYTGHFIRETGENFSYPAHIHQCFELITVLDGSMTVTVDDKEYLLKKNNSVIIFPNQIHSLSSTKCRHLLFIFSADLVLAYYSAHKSEKPICSKFTLSDNLLKEVTNLLENSDLLYKKGLLYLVFNEFNIQAKYKMASSNSMGLLEKIFLFIADSFSDECSLETLSRALGYNPSYISRYFNKMTGMGLNHYINIYRLSYAGNLIQNTDSSILSCAMESGFSSVRTFNRNFKKVFGVSPVEYRLCNHR